MDLSKKTKAELLEIIGQRDAIYSTIRKELDDKIKQMEGDQVRSFSYFSRKIQTLDWMYTRSQRQLESSMQIAGNLKVLLDDERRDSEMLMLIQNRLVDLLKGCVSICPKCGKVEEDKNGYHLIVCGSCSSNILEEC